MNAGLLLPLLLSALAGATLASWLGTAMLRHRRGQSAWSGRSRCDHCTAPLGYGDTLPLVSFLLTRGRCRHCGGAISPVHPLSELAGLALGALAFLGLIHV